MTALCNAFPTKGSDVVITLQLSAIVAALVLGFVLGRIWELRREIQRDLSLRMSYSSFAAPVSEVLRTRFGLKKICRNFLALKTRQGLHAFVADLVGLPLAVFRLRKEPLHSIISHGPRGSCDGNPNPPAAKTFLQNKQPKTTGN